MCKLRKTSVFFIFILLAIGLFLTCNDPNNPFSNNLGEKVVVEPPTINIDFPVSGSFISSEYKRDEDGNLIFDTVTFTGRAKAYIKVEKVEVYIYEDQEFGQREVKWTSNGIRLSGDVKNKIWTYEFNPANYNNYDFETRQLVAAKDGPIKMLFRVFDSTGKSVESVPLAYIIKTRPSIIKMAAPSNTDIANPAKISDIPYGGDIRGTIIDRRGLRPGYPQIKIWPANLPQNQLGYHSDGRPRDEPDDDDPEWGYATLFLSTYDSYKEDNVEIPGTYTDRRTMRVVNAASFSYRLAERESMVIDPENPDLRPIQYKIKDGKHILFGPGRVFNFKIRTSDTSSDPLNKMIPTDDLPRIEGYFPPMGFGTPNEDAFLYRTDSSGLGQPVKINIFNTDTRPTVEINNDDIAPTVLSAKPNIYITEQSSKKIIPSQTSNLDLFRLRLKAGFPDGDGSIFDVKLSWIHESSPGRSGELTWTSMLSADDFRPVSFPDNNGVENAYFTFEAKANLLDKDGKPIFTSSPDPYILIFTVQTSQTVTDIKPPEYRYVVYLDGEPPNVSIRSIKGAAEDPAGSAVPVSDGLVNKNQYTVNGNIQVVVDRSDDSGIMVYKPDNNMGQTPPEDGYPMVKWIAEAATESEAEPTGAILEKLKEYRKNPTADNLRFFYDITETPPDYKSGWVRRPVANSDLAADRANHFKINTTAWDDKNYYWLYVIAQDQVQNLGFIVQKIYVDQETDKPQINVRTLFKKNAADADIADEKNLDVNVEIQNTTRKMTGNWKEGTRNNILARNQGIDLNFTDDDGIKLIADDNGPGGITIKLTLIAPLTDVPGPKTVTINAEDVLKAGGIRDRSGVLTQEIMAKALYGADSDGSLRDGMYKIEFEVTDDIYEKVDIPLRYRTETRPPSSQVPGDTPRKDEKASAVYYFAVSTEMPKITIKYPDDNAWGSGDPIIIEGEVRSRLDIKSLWITFTPNVVSVSPGALNPPSVPIKVDLTPVAVPAAPAVPAVPDDKDVGYYIYNWKYAPPNPGKDPGVIFHPIKSDQSAYFTITDYPTREFSMEAYDRIGNAGFAKRNVQIDGKGPDVTISDFNYGRPPEVEGSVTTTYVYGKVSFTASATDENGLYEVDGKSGIKWFVVEKGTVPSWSTEPPVYKRADLPSTPVPPALPAGAPAEWTGGGNFLLNQSIGGRYSWVIDTRYLKNGQTYRLYIVALDKAGNPNDTSDNPPAPTSRSYEEFKVDWKRDYPTIDENSLDPLKDSVKPKGAIISGTISDIDMFNPAKKNTYVSIRFPKATVTGKPASTADWDEWILINISDTYSASSGGIDPSGAIVYKYRPAAYTSPAGIRANTYLSNDGVKYYQIKVTDEPTGPTDAEKTAGAKWYGKNPDLFMKDNPLYPSYPYVEHGGVSIVFPANPKDFVTNPDENPPDAYSFIVDDTYPEIFFDKWDPTKTSGNPPVNHPGYSDARPTFSSVDLLIAALKGYVQEYKLSDFSISYSGKIKNASGVLVDATFRKLIINNIKETPDFPDAPANGQYPWDLSTGTTKFDITPTGADYLFKQIFDAAEQGMQIITFEATDMVPQTRRISYVFAKDTQGPDINFNSIGRAIKRKPATVGGVTEPASSFYPGIPATGEFPTAPAWPSDWRYSGTAWSAWSSAWQSIILYWPAEYAFKNAAAVIVALTAEDSRSPSTVIGDPEENYGKPGYSAPVIEGNFSDLYSSIKILVPADATTYFYYRFRKKDGTLQAIPAENKAPAPLPVSGDWIRKSIETLGSDGKPLVQNEKEANWKIELNKNDGFTGTDGENWFDIWVADSAGNISDIYNVRFLLDRTPPIMGEEPNPYDEHYNPTQQLTDAGEFIISEVNGASWGTTPTAQNRLPEMMRVFSAAGAANDNVAFKIQGKVSDYNFSGLTITIGQEGYGYSINASLEVDPTAAKPNPSGSNGVVTSASPVKPPYDVITNTAGTESTDGTIRRLSLSVPVLLADGTPQWTWTLSILNKDIAALRAAAGTANQDSARRYIRVTAQDKAGKRAGPVDWFFYLDTKKPSLEYTNLNKGKESVASSFEDSKLSLSGLVEDDTRIQDVKFMIGRWDYGTNAWRWYNGTNWTTLTAPPDDRTTWPSAFTSPTVPTRQTSMNWSINQTLLDAINAAKPNTFPANLFNTEGYYRIDLYITDFSIGNGNPHDTYFATDAFNDERFVPGTPTVPWSGTMSGRVFYIDKEDPALRWGWWTRDANGVWTAVDDDPYNPNNTTYFRNVDGQARFSFTVGDGNTIKEWSVKVVDNSDTNTATNTTLNQTITAQTTKKKWEASNTSASGPIPIPSTALPSAAANQISLIAVDDQKLIAAPFMTDDGTADSSPTNTKALDVVLKKLPTYTITITVKDGAGRTSSISKQFTLDNTPPRFIQDNFSPSSYKRGDQDKPAASEEISAPGYDPEKTKRTYSYDALTGRMNIRGSTTDNSNQIKRISYYVVKRAGANFATSDFPQPSQLADNLWRYSGGTGNNAPEIKSGDTTIMEIDQGTFAWRIMVPQTSLFFSDTNAKNYAQITKTGGTPLAGPPSVTAGNYIDVTITPSFSAVSQAVPGLTFPGLANKVIYGNEEVGLITVYVRAEDMAGNFAYDVLKYWIWPEGDRPIVTAINNPNGERDTAGNLTTPEADRLLNGQIRLSGMAKDNERVKNVWFRVLPSTNGVVAAGATPYTLKIPVWDDDWNATSAYQTAVSDNTSPFTTGGYLGARRSDDPGPTPTTPPAQIGGGWYMANGGNSPEVSWWAYINTEGELDPKNGESKKEFTVQVRAQDVTYDDKNDKWMDYTNTWRGMASVPMSVHAWVVADLPTFDMQRIAPVASDVAEAGETTPPKYWDTIENISIRNRSSYKVTVKHDLGLGAIRWSPTLWDKTLNSNNGAFQANPKVDSFNLLAKNPTGFAAYEPGQYVWLNANGDGYVVGNKAAADAALLAKTTSMALHVKPGTLATGSTTIYKDYVVFIDMNADKLLDKMIADDPKYGTYEMEPNETGYDKSDANKGRAGQVRGSVRYPVYLSASDNSKATPLTARGDALLPIDNLAPYGMYTLNRKPVGTAATIGGEAGDKGPVAGIGRVVLWFQRKGVGSTPGQFVSWHHQGPPAVPEATLPAVTGFQTNNGSNGPAWWNSISVGGGANDVIPTGVSKPYIPPNATDATGGDYAIVIDTNSPSTPVTRWGHKLAMGFADGGIGKLWYVEINSYGIESGPVDLHYVIIDKAGNAKYYKTRLVIMNNVAVIDRIKLGTDIRHSMSVTANTGSLAPGKIDDKTPSMAAADWPVLDTIRKAVPLGGSATDIKDDVKKGISDWIYSSSMGVNKIIDFNVRNNLFALRVETTKAPVDKGRTFRVEYISGATLLSDTGGTGQKLTDIKAGSMYMINNPGSGKWGMFGADGDGPWPRGYTFIATIGGNELDATAQNNIGTGSVWQINTVQSIRAPATDNDTSRAVSAEFRYGTGAFGAGNIIDYVHQTDAEPDIKFPPTANATYTDWPTWTNNQSLFVIRVYDGVVDDYFGDFTIIRVRVNNDDKTKPFAQLYDLNPKTEGVDRQNIAKVGDDTKNELTRSISPMFIGEGANSNRVKGGLWNNDLKTVSGIEKPGHIEPRQISGTTAPYNTSITINGTAVQQQHSLSSAQMGGAATPASAAITNPFADPRGFFTNDTVSGKVVLRGYAEDDQRIQRVDLSLGSQTVNILMFQASSPTAGQAGYGTLGVTDSSSANYSPPRTGLLSEANSNVYFTDSIDAYRHRVEWAYIWDTETIPSGTVVGVITAQVIAYNRSGVTANGKTASDTMNANTATGATARKVHSDAYLANRPNTTPYNPGFPEGLYEYNQITVNLRPYITGFLRNKTQFSHDTRSLQGRYMFYREETAVVKGFNLGSTGTGTTTITINGSDITTNPVGTIGDFGIPTANNQRYRQFQVGAGVTTGQGLVTYSYNSQYAVNTSGRAITNGPPVRPTYIQPWNIEYSAGVDGSTLWDDFTQVHIWQSNGTGPGSGDPGRFYVRDNGIILNPAMSIDAADGTLYESHNESGSGGNGWYNAGNTKKSGINSASNETVTQFSDPVFFSDVYRSPGNSSNSAYTWAVSSIIGRSSTYNYWRALGGIFINGAGGNPIAFHGGGTGSSDNNPSVMNSTYSSSLYHGESTWYNASTDNTGRTASPPSTDQFMNPHIVTSYSGNYEHIHVSYYDDKDGSIKYRYNLRGSSGTIDLHDGSNNGGTTTPTYSAANVNAVPKMWANLDGGLDQEDADETTYTSSLIGTGNISANSRVVRWTSSIAATKTARGNNKAGKHNSIAVTSQGFPVIAYYDETNQRLKLAVSKSVDPILASNWVIRDYVIPRSNLSSLGTGEFVSMKINTVAGTNPGQELNRVHIAAMNTNKRLVYVTGILNPTAGSGNTLQDENSGSNVLTGVTVQVVDSVGYVGRWCALSLDSNGNPWISYMDESYLGARDGVKVAFLNKTTFYKGVAGGSYFPGKYVDINGTSLEGWETMHVPTRYRVENSIEGPGREHGRLGMECYPTRNWTGSTVTKIWSGAVGYLSQDAEGNVAAMDRYRVAYYVK